MDWQDEHLLDHRRRLRTGMFVSLAVHGMIFATFAIAPPSPSPDAPRYLAVDLVAAPPAAPARPAPSARKSAPEPAPAPEPAAAPAPPPPPIAKAPVQVLPEETPGRIRKAKPEPEVVAKVPPKPTPKPPKPRARKPKEEALSLEDAMAALGDELGVDETADLLKPQEEPSAQGAEEADATATAARTGVTVSPEQAKWDRTVSQKISAWLPNFAHNSGRGLVVQLELVVSATGDLVGEPKLVGSSGDLEFDRMAIAAVEKAAPLPPPPSSGVRRLNVTSE